MTSEYSVCRLDEVALVRVTGADATEFLQGQFSNDLAELNPGDCQRTSYNSPKGRVLAILELHRRAETYFIRIPASLVEELVDRLRRYVMRAKVQFEQFGKDHTAYCVFGANPAAFVEAFIKDPKNPPNGPGESDQTQLFKTPDKNAQLLIASPADATRIEALGTAGLASPSAWQLYAIRHGIPQVEIETTDQFVAQMLNLDLVDGISFTKGCYTGQEVIARTHNLGRTKRRMLRFVVSKSGAPAMGTRVVTDDATAGQVVRAAACENGVELLVVTRLAALQTTLTLDGDDTPLKQLPLPYEIPEIV